MAGMVHDVARVGFGREAEAYERSRPSYPAAAVAWLVRALGVGPGRAVVDLAAGTGKLTGLLAPTGAWVVAVEPVPEMRAVLRRILPAVPVVGGTAERLPFAAGSLDAVTVAQAFHWFDAGAAFAELARVLRPGGRVGLVWNARRRSVDWVDRVWAIMDAVEESAPWRQRPDWRDAAFADPVGFGPASTAEFANEQWCTPEELLDRFRGVSHVAALAAARQAEVLDEVRRLVAGHPETRGRARLAIPYRVDCAWFERA